MADHETLAAYSLATVEKRVAIKSNLKIYSTKMADFFLKYQNPSKFTSSLNVVQKSLL